MLVKNEAKQGPARLFYRDIGDYLSREQKLDLVAHSNIATMDWGLIQANEAGDWINQRSNRFQAYAPIGDKDTATGIFRVYCRGLSTGRDAWVYGSSALTVEKGAKATIDFYNSEVDRYIAFCKANAITDPSAHVDDFINTNAKQISWNRADKNNLSRGLKAPKYIYEQTALRVGTYRPFNKQFVYFNRHLDDMVYQLPSIFPERDISNTGFMIMAPRPNTQFAVLAVNSIPDLSYFTYTAQFFPRYTYAEHSADMLESSQGDDNSVTRIDNISDKALGDYRAAYGSQVTKDDIFYYVYGLLHSPEYRAEFAADLKKMLPRIPMVATADDFRMFIAAGRELATLHIGYESVEPYPFTVSGEPSAGLTETELFDYYHVEKMRFGGRGSAKDHSVVIYNSRITVSGIPDEAYEYLLGSRSAIEWIIERYQVKTDKASGIVNDPNDWSREVRNPRYILDLLARVVTVSMETVRIVRSLPALRGVD